MFANCAISISLFICVGGAAGAVFNLLVRELSREVSSSSSCACLPGFLVFFKRKHQIPLARIGRRK